MACQLGGRGGERRGWGGMETRTVGGSESLVKRMGSAVLVEFGWERDGDRVRPAGGRERWTAGVEKRQDHC